MNAPLQQNLAGAALRLLQSPIDLTGRQMVATVVRNQQREIEQLRSMLDLDRDPGDEHAPARRRASLILVDPTTGTEMDASGACIHYQV